MRHGRSAPGGDAGRGGPFYAQPVHDPAHTQIGDGRRELKKRGEPPIVDVAPVQVDLDQRLQDRDHLAVDEIEDARRHDQPQEPPPTARDLGIQPLRGVVDFLKGGISHGREHTATVASAPHLPWNPTLSMVQA